MADAHKRKRHPKYKTRYRIKNWHLYEEGLKARGDITLWFSTDVMDAWLPNPTGKPGRQRQYSELAIETILTLRLVFKLPLRQVEGFVNSLFSMIGLSLRSPDHTTLSRRNRTLAPIIRGDLRRKGPLDIVVDSTGLSIWWALSAGPDRTDTDNTSWATLTSGRNAYGHAVDVAGTASNYWQMTGVQLEIGITATPFEHKTFGRELEDCCRYYQNSYSSVTPDVLPNREDTVTVTSWQDGNSPFPVFPYVMRSSPTVTLRRNGATTTGKVRSAGTERAGVAGSIGKKLVSYITVTSGTATSDVIFSYELDAEL